MHACNPWLIQKSSLVTHTRCHMPIASIAFQFVNEETVRLIGVEAGGEGIHTNKHAATLTMGTPGVLHGSFSYLLQVCVTST